MNFSVTENEKITFSQQKRILYSVFKYHRYIEVHFTFSKKILQVYSRGFDRTSSIFWWLSPVVIDGVVAGHVRAAEPPHRWSSERRQPNVRGGWPCSGGCYWAGAGNTQTTVAAGLQMGKNYKFFYRVIFFQRQVFNDSERFIASSRYRSAGQVRERTPEQRVAESTSRRYSFAPRSGNCPSRHRARHARISRVRLPPDSTTKGRLLYMI